MPNNAKKVKLVVTPSAPSIKLKVLVTKTKLRIVKG